jgi:hypothetical protein
MYVTTIIHSAIKITGSMYHLFKLIDARAFLTASTVIVRLSVLFYICDTISMGYVVTAKRLWHLQQISC